MTSGSSSAPDAGAGNVNVSPLDGADAERYVQAVLSSADYERFRTELGQERGQTFTLQERQATVSRVESGQQQVVGVHVPIAGGAGHSFYGAVLDPDSAAVLSSLSGLFDRTPEGPIAAAVKRDGTVTLDVVMTQEGNILSGTLTTDSGTTDAAGLSVPDLFALVTPVPTNLPGCVNDCLANAGIPNYLITAIAVACSIACAGTLGTACVACIIAVIGAMEAELLLCINQCAGQA